MSLLTPKRTCTRCGSSVGKPEITGSMICPNCQEDGPWGVVKVDGQYRVEPVAQISGERVEIADEDHFVGDSGCPACGNPYPQRCGCGGLIHGQIDWEGSAEIEVAAGDEVYLTGCDRCGKREAVGNRRQEMTEERRQEIIEFLKATGRYEGSPFDPNHKPLAEIRVSRVLDEDDA